jgi:hypothetical protein
VATDMLAAFVFSAGKQSKINFQQAILAKFEKLIQREQN